MQAWRVHELGEPMDVLRLDTVDQPTPGPGQVRVAVASAALNFPDILYCQGRYQERPPLPFIPGLEASGVVDAVGDGVDAALVGRRVALMPIKPSGGLAGKALADAGAVFEVPDTMDDDAAAGLIITYQTGWFGLHHRAKLQRGETLLVHAGAGGVGSAAIQLGKAAGATVIATAGGPTKVGICEKLGADVAIDYVADDFVEAVKEVTDGRGADVIYDPVGGDVFDRSRKIVAWEGRIVVVGFTSNRIADAPTNHVLLKNYAVVGVHWGAYLGRDPELVRYCHDQLMELHHAGAIAPAISRVAPFEDAPDAITRLGTRETWGKIVVHPPAA